MQLYNATAAILLLLSINTTHALSQEESPTADQVAADIVDSPRKGKSQVADEVKVDPTTSDEQIERRLTEILESTGWFDSPSVEVENGVAFLSGTADSTKHAEWAESTAIKTTDVVAVVNRMQVNIQNVWTFAPAIESFRSLARDLTRLLPLVLVAAIVLGASVLAAFAARKLTESVVKSRIDNLLLKQVIGRVVAISVVIVGCFLALRVSGLTYIAATLLGGTSLIGLAIGFAFRDIAENYLASILLSMNQPFRVGDLIEVGGTQGFVRKLTTRGTILNTFEGNQVQLPNSLVFKEKITNYTASPMTRADFSVGIGFDDSVSDAQSILVEILRGHEAVATDPNPSVVVEALGAATVNLRVYFWIDQTEHSLLKVKSAVIRRAKQSLTEARITMPDEAREIVFPKGVPVHMPGDREDKTVEAPIEAETHSQDDASVTAGEGSLESEKAEIDRVTTEEGSLDDSPNLLSPAE
ncbi:MAG: mechanosensitive ion channel family protein [Aureliella sp.]